jgi:hypothetical protein
MFSRFEQAVGQDSSPAADAHVGLFALGDGWFRCAKSVRGGRADLEIPPHNRCSISGIGKLSGATHAVIFNRDALVRR